MAEFNWTIDDIKRAQRDFSNNFMRLDCIRTESYDIAIDCMTECIENKVADVQLRQESQGNELCDYWESCDHYALCNRAEKQKMCHCGGDERKCDFYPEIKERAGGK